MRILGLETSCDETAAAVVDNGTKIISNIVATSADMHTKTGGIIPEQAAREQIKSILPVIQKALENIDKNSIDALAVTVGPGLIGSLLVGVETAKTLSMIWDKPIIPVNHLVGHIYANFIGNTPPTFPLLALVVSGGHTDLVLMKDHGRLEYIGGTRDDAAGEAFDKTARILDLPYPGGPSISKLAEKFKQENPNEKLNLFPRPMINEDNFEWSFSGLKTAVNNYIKNIDLDDKTKEKLAAEIETAIVEVLVAKAMNAIKKYQPKSFLLAGGVSANKALRSAFEEKLSSDKLSANSVDFVSPSLHVPSVELCTDNAAYIASAAYFNNHPVGWDKADTYPELTITDKFEL